MRSQRKDQMQEKLPFKMINQQNDKFFVIIMLALIKIISGKNFHNTFLTAEYKTKMRGIN